MSVGDPNGIHVDAKTNLVDINYIRNNIRLLVVIDIAKKKTIDKYYQTALQINHSYSIEFKNITNSKLLDVDMYANIPMVVTDVVGLIVVDNLDGIC